MKNKIAENGEDENVKNIDPFYNPDDFEDTDE